MMQARLALFFVGVLVWGYGIQAQNPDVRLVGIGLLAASLVLRFAPPPGGRGRENGEAKE